MPARNAACIVVVMAPLLDNDLRLLEAVEHFAIVRLVVQLAVAAFAVAISPRGCLARCGVSWPRFANEPHTILASFRTVVRAEKLGDAAHEHHIRR
jgi:hypothetical protein